MKLSFCITNKNRSRVDHGGKTLELFPNCVKSLAKLVRATDSFELIVSDWESTDWPLDEWIHIAAGPLPVRIVPINKEGFSRGYGLNAAVEHAEGDAIFILDTDILVGRPVVDYGLATVRDGYAFFPSIYYRYNDRGGAGFWGKNGYGLAMVSRKTFYDAGRYPVFWEWCGADTLFHYRVAKVASIARISVDESALFHQWHPRTDAFRNRYGKRTKYFIVGISDDPDLAGLLQQAKLNVSFRGTDLPDAPQLYDFVSRMYDIVDRWVGEFVGDVDPRWLDYVEYLLDRADPEARVICIGDPAGFQHVMHKYPKNVKVWPDVSDTAAIVSFAKGEV